MSRSLYSVLLLVGSLFTTEARSIEHINRDDSHIHKKQAMNNHIHFQHFINKYSKSYNTKQEYDDRFKVFTENLNAINTHNSQVGISYTLAINEFADLSKHEFKTRFLHSLPPRVHSKHRLHPHHHRHNDTRSEQLYPDSLDWRTSGVVSPVRDQGQCGAPWAFETVDSVTSGYAIKHGQLVPLSVQEIIDCAGSDGCNGGSIDDAFTFVVKNGLASEADYPFSGTAGTCRKVNPTASVSSFVDIPKGDETELLAGVNVGPTIVNLAASSFAFQFYAGGILTSTSCGGSLDHSLLLVGYGTQSDTPYWIVKNSWGASWGESGYIRIKRNQDICGIADGAAYPVVV